MPSLSKARAFKLLTSKKEFINQSARELRTPQGLVGRFRFAPALKNQRAIKVEYNLGPNMLHTMLPVRTQVVET